MPSEVRKGARSQIKAQHLFGLIEKCFFSFETIPSKNDTNNPRTDKKLPYFHFPFLKNIFAVIGPLSSGWLLDCVILALRSFFWSESIIIQFPKDRYFDCFCRYCWLLTKVITTVVIFVQSTTKMILYLLLLIKNVLKETSNLYLGHFYFDWSLVDLTL